MIKKSRPARRVLISGASIAGPTLAYWLDRYGFDVTVVEKAAAVRGGGYAIDIRGTAREVVDRMGLLPRLTEAHVDSRRITFVDAAGEAVGSVRPEQFTGGEAGLDLEVRRGDLADALHAPVRERVEFLFSDSIATLDDTGDAVHVVFDSGIRRTFDLVIGADGLHSNTRRLVFGPEEPFHHYLGRVFAGFTLPNEFGFAHEAAIWNEPGRSAVLYAYEESDHVHGFLTFADDLPPFDAFRDPRGRRDLVAARFPEQVWHVPRLVEAMREADDLFCDIVSQIHMPTWSRGRVVLAGMPHTPPRSSQVRAPASRSSARTSWPANSPYARTMPRPSRPTSAGCGPSRSSTRRWRPTAARWSRPRRARRSRPATPWCAIRRRRRRRWQWRVRRKDARRTRR